MKIKLDKGKKLRGQSLFVKLDKTELDQLDVIKSFRGHYHVPDRTWELPKKSFEVILDKCFMCNIQIVGSITSDMEKYLDRLDRYDEGSLPYASNTKPYSYQMESYEYSLDHTKFLLADEQGLGKTKQALDIAVSKKHLMQHCLIVCGVNELKWNWVKEVGIHTNEKGHILGEHNGKIGSVSDRVKDLCSSHDEFFLITNIETLRDKKVQEQITLMCKSGVIGMTIIDEIHKCKNYTSQQGKAIHACCSHFKLALTGTPLMNNAIDLYNILRWLEVENHSLTEFKTHYCIMGGFGGYQIVGYKNEDELEDRLGKYMLRRKKDDVLDLPPKIYTDEVLEMTPGQQQLYDEAKKYIQDNIDKIMLLPNPLTELIRLRQVTGNPDILSSKRFANVKFNRMIEIVDEVTSNGGKVIVFSNWTKVINPACEVLRAYEPALVTGEVKNNQDEINRFKTDKNCKVILGTIPCLGTGFTLNEANTVIFLDEPWTYAEKAQAEDRCHRIGTKGAVNIITLMCKGTVDEQVHKIVTDKQDLSNKIVDNKKLFMDIMEG